MKTKTYDIHFNDSESSNSMGVTLSLEEAVEYAKSGKCVYRSMYKGGTVSVVCNETEETVFSQGI
jgi:hypothetical protein